MEGFLIQARLLGPWSPHASSRESWAASDREGASINASPLGPVEHASVGQVKLGPVEGRAAGRGRAERAAHFQSGDCSCQEGRLEMSTDQHHDPKAKGSAMLHVCRRSLRNGMGQDGTIRDAAG